MDNENWLKFNVDIEAELQERSNLLALAECPQPVIATTYLTDLDQPPGISSEPVPLPLTQPILQKYIPGKVFFPKDITSNLTKRNQALCLQVLKHYQSGNGKPEVSEAALLAYHAMQKAIQGENAKFLKYVSKDWESWCSRADVIKPVLREYARAMWEQHLLHALSYPQYYKPVNPISLSNEENETAVEVCHLQNVLRVGTVTAFHIPTLIVKETPTCEALPVLDHTQTYDCKLPVSQDLNIQDLVLDHDVDVVISSSSLKRLMDDSDFNIEWDIPIVVKQIKNSKGTKKNVIYIDKTLPRRNPNNADFNEQCHKRLIKYNYCVWPEITYDKVETAKLNPNFHGGVDPSEPDPYLYGRPRKEPTDFMKKVLGETNYHNATYDIWKMKVEDDNKSRLMKSKVSGKEIKLLVRCKLDACAPLKEAKDGIQPLVIVPKIEYQVEHGAGIATKSEIIRQWTALFFRPFSLLYRVRMMENSSEIVSIETVTMQKINNEANTHHQYKPHLRLGVLYKILQQLVELQPGNFLLRHTSKNGPFMYIYKADELDSRSPILRNIYNLHKTYQRENCNMTTAENKPWCPIDVHYILPVHTTYKRMPGMFKPLIVHMGPNILKKKKKKKLKKIRAKFNKLKKLKETKPS